MALLCAIVLAGSYVEFGTLVTNGRVVKAKVLRFGTYSDGKESLAATCRC